MQDGITISANNQLYKKSFPDSRRPGEEHSDSGNPQRSMVTQANGMPQSSNNTKLDGATISHPWLPRIIAYVPPVEAVQEVNVVSNSFDAEQGMAGGAAMNVTIKSGTNQFHGGGNAGRALNPSFGRIADVRWFAPFNTAAYNGLLTSVTRRFSRSLLGVSYTWSRSIGYVDD